ncbi:MAG: flavin reductase [Clostridia bacterium]|nr:flavin reductase [Clostridia bacterium]
MNQMVLQNITYGLFLISVKDGEKDNACIVNTVMQVAYTPNRISVAVSKDNLTHEMIQNTGFYNASIISKDADFALFQRFGLQSGRDVDKFQDFSAVSRSENGLYYLTEQTNGFLSVKVEQQVDLGTHTLFIGTMTDGEILAETEPCTYAYYHTDIKKLPKEESSAKGWRCNICGYVHEGEDLPDDFICPWCKHGAEDFTKIV